MLKDVEVNIVNEKELEVLSQLNPLLFVVCFCISGLLLFAFSHVLAQFYLSLRKVFFLMSVSVR